MPPTTPRRPDRPILWIVAGPNGSGKSTLYNRTDIEGWGGSVWIINPDLLSQQIFEREQFPLAQANGASLDRIMTWLEASIDAYQTIGVETVLSSDKYRDLIAKARARGFEVNMLYVVLQNADLQLARIRERVASGGHDVPVDKVVTRRTGSFEQLAWFLKHVDSCAIFNNSGAQPMIAGELKAGRLVYYPELPRDLLGILQANDVPLDDWRDDVLG